MSDLISTPKALPLTRGQGFGQVSGLDRTGGHSSSLCLARAHGNNTALLEKAGGGEAARQRKKRNRPRSEEWRELLGFLLLLALHFGTCLPCPCALLCQEAPSLTLAHTPPHCHLPPLSLSLGLSLSPPHLWISLSPYYSLFTFLPLHTLPCLFACLHPAPPPPPLPSLSFSLSAPFYPLHCIVQPLMALLPATAWEDSEREAGEGENLSSRMHMPSLSQGGEISLFINSLLGGFKVSSH